MVAATSMSCSAKNPRSSAIHIGMLKKVLETKPTAILSGMRDGLSAVTPANALTISTISIGRSGKWSIRALKGLSASSTAEISAAAAGIVPASPTPLTPSGLSGERVSL